MGLINLLFKDPFAFVLVAVPLLYSIILHELAHGWVAYKMGDPTAKWLGRLTLNPIKNLYHIGTAMLFIFGFDWAKTVPVDCNRLHPLRKGLLLVSAAWLTAILLLALVLYFLLRYMTPSPLGPFYILLTYMFQINVMLASFNLIPIPPLDGSKILMGFVSTRVQYSLERIEPYGFFIIIGALWLGILNPLIDLLKWVIVSIIRLLLP